MPNSHNTKSYVELEMILGQEAAEKLINAYRGQEVYIPAADKLHGEHKLVKLLGLDVALRLSHYWHNTILTVPMQRAKTIAQRNAEIIKRYKSGTDKGEIAALFGLHTRTVRKIIANYHDDKAKAVYARLQLSLLDY